MGRLALPCSRRAVSISHPLLPLCSCSIRLLSHGPFCSRSLEWLKTSNAKTTKGPPRSPCKPSNREPAVTSSATVQLSSANSSPCSSPALGHSLQYLHLMGACTCGPSRLPAARLVRTRLSLSPLPVLPSTPPLRPTDWHPRRLQLRNHAVSSSSRSSRHQLDCPSPRLRCRCTPLGSHAASRPGCDNLATGRTHARTHTPHRLAFSLATNSANFRRYSVTASPEVYT